MTLEDGSLSGKLVLIIISTFIKLSYKSQKRNDMSVKREPGHKFTLRRHWIRPPLDTMTAEPVSSSSSAPTQF